MKIHLLFSLSCAVMLAGCATVVGHLNSTSRAVTVRNIVGANNLPMGLTVMAPDNLPMAQRGGLDMYAPVKIQTIYSLRMAFEQVCTEGVKANFRLVRPGEIPPYKIEMVVTRSLLTKLPNNSVEYKLDVAFALKDAMGERVMGRTLSAMKLSPFDNMNLPAAVWDASVDIFEQAMSLIAADTHTLALLKKAEPLSVGTVYECDVQVLDLSGRRVIGVSGKANNPAELRALADTLVRQLDERWVRKGIPKVAVLDFRTSGASRGQDVGASFASFIESSLEKGNLCVIVDRKRLDLIMQEHDLRSADVALNPLQLENVQIPIDTVQFFVTGQISILGGE